MLANTDHGEVWELGLQPCPFKWSGNKHIANTMFRLDTPSAKGTKRKWAFLQTTEDLVHTSLVLGLGHSPISSDTSRSSATICTMPSAKEIEEHSSIDLELNYQLHLGNKNMFSAKKRAVPAPKALESPLFDIGLSLSTGPSESVVTSINPETTVHQNTLDASVLVGSREIVDDGSTSSRWKFGGLIQPMQTSEASWRFPYSQNLPAKVSPLQATPVLPSTSTRTWKRPVTLTSGAIHPPPRNTNTKNCQFLGCLKGARGASRLCIAHGGGQRCQRPGCGKGAEGSTIFCKAHGGGRRCMHLGCTKSAEGRTDHCIAHGGGLRCSHDGCARAARGKSGVCIRHGGGKRCQKENCKKSAEGSSGFCISHGGGRRCQFPECTKGAQGSTMYCKAHGGGKRCTYPGCTKGAEGSTPFCKGHGGGKRCSFPGGCPKSVHGGTQYCVAHGGGKRCAIPECTKSARGRTNFCVRHGGGKRCQNEGCGKSAQGSTDYCKAHGGGKRCAWGQAGSELGSGGPPCDRFARGKIGLCAAHSALIQDLCVHGSGVLAPSPSPGEIEKMKMIENGHGHSISWSNLKPTKLAASMNPHPSSPVTFPEPRVHGGSLIALLARSTILGSCFGVQTEAENSEQDASTAMAHDWL